MISRELIEDAKEQAEALRTRARIRRSITKREDKGDRLSNQLEDAARTIEVLLSQIREKK